MLEENDIVIVGEIGDYYPARVWISNLEKIYATHDYEKNVLVFLFVVKLIEYEIEEKKLTFVTMK